MALNKAVFKTRALTALVFVVVMLCGMLQSKWSFLLLFSIIHFGCWWEYFKLIEKIYRINFHWYLKLGMALMGYSLMLVFCGKDFAIGNYLISQNLALPVSAAGFLLLAMGILQKQTLFTLKAFAAAGLGWLYISFAWACMIGLRRQGMDSFFGDWGWIWPLVLIAAIWINDTMAYLVGSFIGKTPLSPISPKKTWEGTIGGAVLTIAVVVLVGHFAYNMDVLPLIVISSIAAVVGTLGDLLESKLKRLAGVKDSGEMMPGHGGFLDRFDSMLLATPFAWAYVLLFT